MRVIDSFPLLYHELGHLWHFQRRTAPAWAEDPAARALWQLYTEGMATYVQQRLFGGRSFYSQDRDGWLAWCGANRARLFAAFRRRVDGGESVQDFFGDWCAFEDRSDVGYYLGAELVYALAENRSPQQGISMRLVPPRLSTSYASIFIFDSTTSLLR